MVKSIIITWFTKGSYHWIHAVIQIAVATTATAVVLFDEYGSYAAVVVTATMQGISQVCISHV